MLVARLMLLASITGVQYSLPSISSGAASMQHAIAIALTDDDVHIV